LNIAEKNATVDGKIIIMHYSAKIAGHENQTLGGKISLPSKYNLFEDFPSNPRL
jgi:hypothetical protein